MDKIPLGFDITNGEIKFIKFNDTFSIILKKNLKQTNMSALRKFLKSYFVPIPVYATKKFLIESNKTYYTFIIKNMVFTGEKTKTGKDKILVLLEAFPPLVNE